MDLVQSPWHVIDPVIIFIFGLFVVYTFRKYFYLQSGRACFLYLWHTGFCLIYVVYVLADGGDSIAYYRAAKNGGVVFSLGTSAVDYLTWVFVALFNLSFLGTFLVFNLFGVLGLLAFDASLRAVTWYKSRKMRELATLIVILPSVSFWSSAIGKDSLAFMSVGLALWAALDLRRRAFLMAFAVFVMLLVRPHVAGLMVVALSISLITQSKMSLLQRTFLGGAAISAAALLIPLALNYVGLTGGVSLSSLQSYIEVRQEYNQTGGGAIDITSMSPPMQLFTYLFRPLPFEAHHIPSLAASIDNMVLLFLVCAGGGKILIRRTKRLVGNRTFMWSYVLMVWPIMAMTTANLGISVRQKWMFVPMLIFLLISVMGAPRRPAHYPNSYQRDSRGVPVSGLKAV